MGKILMYIAWFLAIAGAIITRFVYEVSDTAYIIYIVIYVLLGVLGYYIDKKKADGKD
jgi:predicted membrane channel-forming protein YqfA (hemolysin III family)